VKTCNIVYNLKKNEKKREKGLTKGARIGIIEKRLTERALRKERLKGPGSRMGP
jgi:hypothetical protein